MSSRPIKSICLGLWGAMAIALWGCSGGNTTAGEETALVAQAYEEGCTLCHRAASIADIAMVHTKEENSPQGQITSVTVDAGTVIVNFKLFESTNNLIPLAGVSASSIRFTVAKLVAGADGVNSWQSYINRTETKEAGDPGSSPDGTSTIQATFERANARDGVFVDHQDGSYSYTFSFDISNVTSPMAVTYASDLTHRVAMQVSDNVANAYYDFIPDGGTPMERAIVANGSCNSCHIKLGLHGGDRIQVDYCVTCHNPGTIDANSNNTVDFKVMIHKIHAGEVLPEVEDGGKYRIWGFGGSEHDYSTVVFPQDLRNCSKCHTSTNAATPQGDNWKNVPSMAACTACHEAPEGDDYPDFPDLTAAEIGEAHQIPALIAAAAFQYNIINIADTMPGDYPTVTFSITDPTNGDTPYDILNDLAFTATGGASRLAILIGWETTDYANTGSGSSPAQPISINPLTQGIAVDNGDGTFSVTAPTAIPLTVVGSGVVAIEGHPAGDFDGDGTYSDRVPVTSVTEPFAITESVAGARRTVVDIDKCKECHGSLSLHGNNRTDNPQICVICHNADATDIDVRPAAIDAVDGKVEEAIDFKYMIHSIHAGSQAEHGFRTEGIVLYGFGGSVHDYSEVRLPNGAENLKNCTGCHKDDSFTLPLSEVVQPTTILTQADLSSPDDDTNITPTAAVCTACHDALASKTHMSEQGAQFDFVPFRAESNSGGSAEADLCGPGPVSAQPQGHSTRLDCCSCHGFQ